MHFLVSVWGFGGYAHDSNAALSPEVNRYSLPREGEFWGSSAYHHHPEFLTRGVSF